jgi:hypothetical protein
MPWCSDTVVNCTPSGVSYQRREGKYRVRVRLAHGDCQRRILPKLYDSEIEAALAHDEVRQNAFSLYDRDLYDRESCVTSDDHRWS